MNIIWHNSRDEPNYKVFAVQVRPKYTIPSTKVKVRSYRPCTCNPRAGRWRQDGLWELMVSLDEKTFKFMKNAIPQPQNKEGGDWAWQHGWPRASMPDTHTNTHTHSPFSPNFETPSIWSNNFPKQKHNLGLKLRNGCKTLENVCLKKDRQGQHPQQ